MLSARVAPLLPPPPAAPLGRERRHAFQAPPNATRTSTSAAGLCSCIFPRLVRACVAGVASESGMPPRRVARAGPGSSRVPLVRTRGGA